MRSDVVRLSTIMTNLGTFSGHISIIVPVGANLTDFVAKTDMSEDYDDINIVTSHILGRERVRSMGVDLAS